ncbi:MAG: ATP phosphoribosyltransferase [Dehalococcoidales bacterium]
MKIALPKGRLLDKTSTLLHEAGWELDGYDSKSRFYHIKSGKFPRLRAKVFHEKDIPIQVAVGNYDLGICGLDWIEELLAGYPGSALVKISALGYAGGSLYMVACPETADAMKNTPGSQHLVSIVSEYPNLSESFALNRRFGRFSVFPVWGGAEVYPPENADLALVRAASEAEIYGYGMVPVSKILEYGSFLIANRHSWESKNLGKVVASICDHSAGLPDDQNDPSPVNEKISVTCLPSVPAENIVRLALPDGHQQQPVVELLSRAGINVEDYPSSSGNRRPVIDIDGVAVKVIRPQDMPVQVANGNFDIAITGRDWLTEHLNQFPSSPVRELTDLGFGRVRIVAVVGQTMPADDTAGLRRFCAERETPLRVASEYVNVADKYARDNHLGHYRIVPTWGATEAFLPEDADLLIENTQTGKTIAEHNLKIIETLFESTACLVGNTGIKPGTRKGEIIASIVTTLQEAVAA